MVAFAAAGIALRVFFALFRPLFIRIALAAAGLRVLARRGAIFFVLDRLARLLLLWLIRFLRRLIFVGFFPLGRFTAAGALVHVVLIAPFLIVAPLLVWLAPLLVIAVRFVLLLFLSASLRFAVGLLVLIARLLGRILARLGLRLPIMIFGRGILRAVTRLLLIGVRLLVCAGLTAGLLLLIRAVFGEGIARLIFAVWRRRVLARLVGPRLLLGIWFLIGAGLLLIAGLRFIALLLRVAVLFLATSRLPVVRLRLLRSRLLIGVWLLIIRHLMIRLRLRIVLRLARPGLLLILL